MTMRRRMFDCGGRYRSAIRVGPTLRYSRGKFAWSPRSPMRWLPDWFNKALVHYWNPIGCKIFGHSYLCQESPDKLPVCCDCGESVVPKPGQSVTQEW